MHALFAPSRDHKCDLIFSYLQGRSCCHIRASTNVILATNDLVLVGDKGKPKEAYPLLHCKGNCKSEKECAQDVKCFKRKKFEKVPGCDGDGEKGKDYCYHAGLFT